MAFLEKVLGKKGGIDVDDFLNTLDSQDENLYEDAEAFVKPLSLATDVDADTAVNEAKSGNIVLLNIGDMSKRNALKLRELVSKIKEGIDLIDGDIARISQDKILITPSKVKIIKKKEAQ